MRLNATLLLALSGIILALHPATKAVSQFSSQPHAALAQSSAEESRAPSVVPCPESPEGAESEPLGAGPARLAIIHCLDLPRGQNFKLPPVVSPDGRSVAFWDEHASPLDVVALDSGYGFRLYNRVTFRGFGYSIQSYRHDALVWRSDGSGLWAVEQQVVPPNGWALSGLTPVQIDRGGNIRRFASPEHAAGPLDAIAWAGGDGRAIAQFGTRGSSYRPVHDDPSPTLAMIDVPGRRVLHTLTIGDAEVFTLRANSHDGFGLFDVSAVQLGDGRLRALLQFRRSWSGPAVWLLWTQGQKPTPLTPFFDEDRARAELTPDGSHVLAWRPLQPEGIVVDDCRNCPPPSPPTPVDAAVAALIGTRSGRTVWTLEGRASEFWSRLGGPVISPSGEVALIPLPDVDQRQVMALLSMADGRILQRFSLGCANCYRQSFGFTRSGGQMWIWTMNRLAFYDLR